jgi:hypothetical protein
MSPSHSIMKNFKRLMRFKIVSLNSYDGSRTIVQILYGIWYSVYKHSNTLSLFRHTGRNSIAKHPYGQQSCLFATGVVATRAEQTPLSLRGFLGYGLQDNLPFF